MRSARFEGSAWSAALGTLALCVAVTGCTGPGGVAPDPAAGPPDGEPADISPRALFREALTAISRHALGRSGVDWEREGEGWAVEVAEEGAVDTAYPAIEALLARLGDPHARLIPAARGMREESPPADDGETSHPTIPTVPTGQVLSGGVGYVLMPGCSAGEVEGLRRYAEAARAEIVRLHAAGVRGWVIDLRLNGGGNLWPMLLGLAPLLGEGPALATVAEDRGVAHDAGVASQYGVSREHGAWIDWGRGSQTQLAMTDSGPDPALWTGTDRDPIAALIGPWTMSSGEALAIALLSRGASRTFGEPTAGLTTVTNSYPLSDGSVLVLPVSRMAGLDGVPVVGRIAPSAPVAFDDWPDEDDAVAEAARLWVIEQIGSDDGGRGG